MFGVKLQSNYCPYLPEVCRRQVANCQCVIDALQMENPDILVIGEITVPLHTCPYRGIEGLYVCYHLRLPSMSASTCEW